MVTLLSNMLILILILFNVYFLPGLAPRRSHCFLFVVPEFSFTPIPDLAAVWRTQRLTLRQYVTIANGGKAVREAARLDFYYLTNADLVSFIYLIASDIE